MEKVTVKTVELEGAEMKVEGLSGQNTVIVNYGSGTLYASAFLDVEAGADNVIEIPAGARDGLNDTHGTVYLLGTGRVELRGTDYAVNFRQPSSSSSGSGGGGGTIGGVFAIASMNDDPDILHIEGVPNDSYSVASAISEKTGLEIVTPTSGNFAGLPLLVLDDVGLLFKPKAVLQAYKENGQWKKASSLEIQMIGDDYSSIIIDLFIKKDLIAVGYRPESESNVCLTCMFAQDTNDKWHTAGLLYNNSYYNGLLCVDNGSVEVTRIRPVIYSNSGYMPDPTVWLFECPTFSYGDNASFKSLYLMASALWTSDITSSANLLRNAKLVGSAGTLMNVGNAFYGSKNKIFIRK